MVWVRQSVSMARYIRLIWSAAQIANHLVSAVFTLLYVWLAALQFGNWVRFDVLLFYRVVEQCLNDGLMSMMCCIGQVRETVEVLGKDLAIADLYRPATVLGQQGH